MTNTNTQFVSKEHYLAFRKAWSNAVNSDKAKTRCEERTLVTTYAKSTYEETYTECTKGWVTGTHHVLYNILRNRTFHKGFTMINKRIRLVNGTDPSLGLGQAVWNLKRIIRHIEQEEEYNKETKSFLSKFRKPEKKTYWGTSDIDEFLAPFGGTVTREMLKAIELPTVKPMWTGIIGGKDAKVVAGMLNGTYDVHTYDDLLKARAEVEK